MVEAETGVIDHYNRTIEADWVTRDMTIEAERHRRVFEGDLRELEVDRVA